ncbi:MAG: hypothetical protein ABSE16_18380 [Verrucomicrobiota bacterium]|jgi:hypothetical protein
MGGAAAPPYLDMIGWEQLTVDDVLAQFNSSEQLAYDAAKGDTDMADLGLITSRVISQIRHAYRDGGRVVDATEGTLPVGEFPRAIAIVRWLYLQALPGGKALLTEDRQKSHDDAQKYFESVARRQISVPGSVAKARPGRRVRTDSFDGMSQT